MEMLRLQGRVEQLRIMESLPLEIKGLLDAFAEADARDRAIAEAKRIREKEVR